MVTYLVWFYFDVIAHYACLEKTVCDPCIRIPSEAQVGAAAALGSPEHFDIYSINPKVHSKTYLKFF